MSIPLRVLILEDKMSDVELSVFELHKSGFVPDWDRIETESDYVNHLDPSLDLILADYSLPQFDGLRALQLLQQRGLDIPFILISGTIGEEVAVECIKQGADDYLLKDRLTRLGPAVKSALEQKRLRDERKLAEAALWETESQLHAVLNNAPITIFATDSHGIFTLSEGKGLEHVGLKPGENVGVSALDLYGSLPFVEFGGKVTTGEDVICRVLAGEEVTAVTELRGVYFDNHIGPLRGTDGKLVGIVGIAIDITERKLAEEALRNAEARYRILFEQSPNGVLLIDLETGKTVEANETAYKQLGYTREEFAALRISDYEVSEKPEETAQHMQKIIREGNDDFETLHRTKNGEIRNMHILAKTVQLSDRMLFYAIFQDITERKRTEEVLRRNEALLLQTGKMAKVGGWELDLLRMKLLWSLETYRIHEVDPSFQPNLDDAINFYAPEARPIIDGAVRRASEDGMPYDLELPFITAKDRHIWVRAIGQPEFRDGKCVRLIGAFQDITERKQAEELTQRQLQRLATLRSIDQAIAYSTDVNFVFKIILDHVISQLNVDAAVILLCNPVTHVLEYNTGRGFRTTALQDTRLPLGEGYAGRAALLRQTIHIPNLQGRTTDLLRSPTFSQERFVSYFGVPLIAKGEIKGVLEVFHRATFEAETEWLNFLETLAGQTAIAIDNATLFKGLQLSNIELTMAYDATIEGWSQAMDLRDKETEGHTQRVTEMSQRLARVMRVNEADLVNMQRGALLHDIGKMGVSDSILLKAGQLTDEEWVVMKQHPQFAYNMLSSIAYLHPALDIPYCHHEKWDGTGYPRGLKGPGIPLSARIFAVIDVWDALTSDRPYRAAWPREKVTAYIQELSGTHFDPEVVDAFIEMLRTE